MLNSLTQDESIKLENILNEKLSYCISTKRNLFNFAVLDELEVEIKGMIKTLNPLIFQDYTNIYQVIDNFEENVNNYIDKRLEEIGD